MTTQIVQGNPEYKILVLANHQNVSEFNSVGGQALPLRLLSVSGLGLEIISQIVWPSFWFRNCSPAELRQLEPTLSSDCSTQGSSTFL